VLDSSAIQALVNDEAGADDVAKVIGDAVVSAVNLAEVVSKLVERGAPIAEAKAAIDVFALETIAFDRVSAERTGALVARTRRRGISLGDRACIALGEAAGLAVYTADRSWADIGLECPLHVIR
jgi:PIN domain nuclease of toxin-antitoxin system